ncbi:unnamed protein product, partial [Meganyctiphanes norvegica]
AGLMKQDDALFRQLLTLHDSIEALKSPQHHKPSSPVDWEDLTEEETDDLDHEDDELDDDEDDDDDDDTGEISKEMDAFLDSMIDEGLEELSDEGLGTDNSTSLSTSPDSSSEATFHRDSDSSSPSYKVECDSNISSPSYSRDCVIANSTPTSLGNCDFNTPAFAKDYDSNPSRPQSLPFSSGYANESAVSHGSPSMSVPSSNCDSAISSTSSSPGNAPSNQQVYVQSAEATQPKNESIHTDSSSVSPGISPSNLKEKILGIFSKENYILNERYKNDKKEHLFHDDVFNLNSSIQLERSEDKENHYAKDIINNNPLNNDSKGSLLSRIQKFDFRKNMTQRSHRDLSTYNNKTNCNGNRSGSLDRFIRGRVSMIDMKLNQKSAKSSNKEILFNSTEDITSLTNIKSSSDEKNKFKSSLKSKDSEKEFIKPLTKRKAPQPPKLKKEVTNNDNNDNETPTKKIILNDTNPIFYSQNENCKTSSLSKKEELIHHVTIVDIFTSSYEANESSNVPIAVSELVSMSVLPKISATQECHASSEIIELSDNNITNITKIDHRNSILPVDFEEKTLSSLPPPLPPKPNPPLLPPKKQTNLTRRSASFSSFHQKVSLFPSCHSHPCCSKAKYLQSIYESVQRTITQYSKYPNCDSLDIPLMLPRHTCSISLPV